MTARERIVATINHREPDVLAIDFGAMRSTGIAAITYNQLLRALDYPGEAKLYDIFQQLAEPDARVLQRLGGDVVQVHRLYPALGINIRDWKQGTLRDGSSCLEPLAYNPVRNAKGEDEILTIDGKVLARRPKDGLYFDQILHPYEACEEPEDIDKIPLGTMSDEEIDFMVAEAKEKFETTDKAILMAYGGNIYEAGQLDFGYEEFFVQLASNPEMMHHYFDRLADNYVSELERLLPKIAPYINLVQVGDDLGTQVASQISLSMYREMIMPYHQRVYQAIQRLAPNAKVFLHSCGAIFDFIPSLIEAGVQVLNPVQISARGMDPAKLKKEYGKDIVFWGGGADMQVFVPTANVDQIRDHVNHLIDTFAPGGGYVFTQVHNIQVGVSPEKILAIYDTALGRR